MMKKHLLGLGFFLVSMLIGTSVWANETIGRDRVNDVKDVDIRGLLDGTQEDDIVRGIRLPSINVSLDDALLVINFQTRVQSSTFVVTNVATGEVVYNSTVATPGTVTIDLIGEDAGNYLLEMRMPYWYFSGGFELE